MSGVARLLGRLCQPTAKQCEELGQATPSSSRREPLISLPIAFGSINQRDLFKLSARVADAVQPYSVSR
jgi:hypothetical protein